MKRPEVLAVLERYDVPNAKGSLKDLRKMILDRQEEEVAPGVRFIEAFSASMHARLIQEGFSTWEVEADRISKDRGRTPATADQEAARAAGDRLMALAKEQSQ
jgi:hypothetical protein